MAEKQEKVPSAEDNSAQSNSSSDFKAVFLSHCVRSTGEQANRYVNPTSIEFYPNYTETYILMGRFLNFEFDLIEK